MPTNSSASESPRILLITTRRWHFASRLAMRFAEAGCEVDIVCAHQHSARRISIIRRTHVYRPLIARRSVMRAIRLSTPALLVPCDDDATTLLHRIYRTCNDQRLRTLIAESIGPETSFDLTQSRLALHELAIASQVLVPRAADACSPAHLKAALEKIGLPAYLKTDGSSGGYGVRIVPSAASAESVYTRLAAPPSLTRALKRASINGDYSLLLAALRRRRPEISLHEAIVGREATHSVFCWRGQVLASVTMQVIVAANQTGPSTVVRHSPDRTVAGAGAALVRRLHLSGFYGFDFIVSSCPITGRQTPYMIEMNARATPTAHLALGSTNDLVAAAVAVLTGRAMTPQPAVTTNPLIALFPGEVLRDPASEFLLTAYHDLPHTEPRLLEECLKPEAAWKQWFTYRRWNRMAEQFRSSMSPAAAITQSSTEQNPAPAPHANPPENELSYPEGTETA